MANYNIYVQHTGGPKTTPVITVEYPENTVTGTGHTSGSPLDLEIGDTLTFQNADTNVGPGTLVISSFGIFTNNDDISILGSDTGSYQKTVASGGTTADTITFDKTNETATGVTDFFYVERQAAPSITPPTISGTSFTYYNNETRALYYTGTNYFVRTTINLSANGSGGTLEYGRNTSSDSVSGASWQTDGQTYSFPSYTTPVTNNANTWNHALGQTRYFYASQDRDTAGTFDSTGAVVYNYVTPNTVTVSNGTVASGATSYDFTLTNCSTDFGGFNNRGAEVYSVSLTDHGSGEIAAATVAGSRFTSAQSTGASTIVRTVDNANLPAAAGGSTETYYVYSYRRGDWSGKEVYIKTDSFVLTRGAAVDTEPDQFTFTDVPSAVAGSANYATVQLAGINQSITVSTPTGSGTRGFYISSSATPSTTASLYTTTSKSASVGQYIHCRVVASATASASTFIVINAGSPTVSDTFTVTTAQDTSPDNYTFNPADDVALNTVIPSNTETITGISGSVSVSVTGDGSPKIKINGGSPVTSGLIQNNQTLSVQLTSASTNSTARTATVTCGTGSFAQEQFTVTTLASGGGGGGGTGGGGSGTYGIEVYDTNGTTKVLSPSTRYLNALSDVISYTFAAVNQAGDSYDIVIDMTDLTTSNSDVYFITGSVALTVSRLSDRFRIENPTASSIAATFFAIRF